VGTLTVHHRRRHAPTLIASGVTEQRDRGAARDCFDPVVAVHDRISESTLAAA
jgi:hypothetical protein